VVQLPVEVSAETRLVRKTIGPPSASATKAAGAVSAWCRAPSIVRDTCLDLPVRGSCSVTTFRRQIRPHLEFRASHATPQRVTYGVLGIIWTRRFRTLIFSGLPPPLTCPFAEPERRIELLTYALRVP
jgi:hypothetical protein